MTSLIRFLSIALILIPNLSFIPPASAATAPVSASVPSQSIGPAILISPADNAALNTTRPTFSWSRPNPLPSVPINHYDFYLDSTIFAGSVPDNLVSQDFYFYTATASGGTFYITLKTDLTQGYHTWKVVDFTDGGASNTTATRTFYVDSIAPYISVTNVDNHNLSWNSGVSGSIPDVEFRYLEMSTDDPVLKGGVEASANIQIILMCPQNIPNCSTYTYTANVPTGLWQTQLMNLIPGGTYTVKISATDAAGNSTIFPDFFITFGTTLVTPTPSSVVPTPTFTPTPTLSVTPTGPVTATPSPTFPLPSATVTPPPGLLKVITPAPFMPIPPAAPTPPPPKVARIPFISLDLFYNFLLILMFFSLPLHLTMATLGAATPLRFLPKFLFILAFPFLSRKKYQTVPFCFMDLYISDKLDRPWQSVVSDIHGFYYLSSPIPKILYLSLSAFGRRWKDCLFKGANIPITCLMPLLVSPLNDRQRLQKSIYDVRLIPLIIAVLTSGTALALKPSYFILVYLYLSVQYLFSEYLYPRL